MNKNENYFENSKSLQKQDITSRENSNIRPLYRIKHVVTSWYVTFKLFHLIVYVVCMCVLYVGRVPEIQLTMMTVSVL